MLNEPLWVLTKTPHVAVIFFAIVVCAFALSGTFRYLAVFATGSLLLIDLGVSLAVLRLRQRDGLPKTGEFRLPFGPLIPLLSCLTVGWLVLQVPADCGGSRRKIGTLLPKRRSEVDKQRNRNAGDLQVISQIIDFAVKTYLCVGCRRHFMLSLQCNRV